MERDPKTLENSYDFKGLTDDQKVRKQIRVGDEDQSVTAYRELNEEERDLRQFFLDNEPTQTEDPTLYSNYLDYLYPPLIELSMYLLLRKIEKGYQ